MDRLMTTNTIKNAHWQVLKSEDGLHCPLTNYFLKFMESSHCKFSSTPVSSVCQFQFHLKLVLFCSYVVLFVSRPTIHLAFWVHALKLFHGGSDFIAVCLQCHHVSEFRVLTCWEIDSIIQLRSAESHSRNGKNKKLSANNEI
jgi:hypothetical protein